MKIIVITSVSGHSSTYRLMADSTMLANDKPFFVPDFAPEFKLRPALAVRIDRLGKSIAPRFAHRYYQCAAACAVVTPTGVEGSSLDARFTAFDGALMMGKTIPLAELPTADGLTVTTTLSEQPAVSTPAVTIEQIDAIIAEASEYFTLKMGDLIVIESGAESQTLHIGERLSGSLCEKPSLTMRIK